MPSLSEFKKKASEKYNISVETVENIIARGFIIPDSKSGLFDSYYLDNENFFYDALNRYNATSEYITSSELSVALLSENANIPIGDIDEMAKTGVIDSYYVSAGHYLFSPDILNHLKDVALKYKDFEIQTEEIEAAEFDIDESDIIENAKEKQNDDAQKSNEDDYTDIWDDYESEEDSKKQKAKKKTSSKSDVHTSTPQVDIPHIEQPSYPKSDTSYNNSTPIETSSATDYDKSKSYYEIPASSPKQLTTEPSGVKYKTFDDKYEYHSTPNDSSSDKPSSLKTEQSLSEDYSSEHKVPSSVSYDDLLKRQAEEQKVYNERSKEEEKQTEFKKKNEQSNYQAPPGINVRNEDGTFSFTGTSVNKEPDFIEKAQISYVATQNVISQNAINEIIDYTRTHKVTVQLPLQDGSYMEFKPLFSEQPPVVSNDTVVQDHSLQQTNTSRQPDNTQPETKHYDVSDYQVSVITFDNSNMPENKVVYSSRDIEHSYFNDITQTYQKGMGVEKIESGYKNEAQNNTDNKVLYAIGVVPKSEAVHFEYHPQQFEEAKFENRSNTPYSSPDYSKHKDVNNSYQNFDTAQNNAKQVVQNSTLFSHEQNPSANSSVNPASTIYHVPYGVEFIHPRLASELAFNGYSHISSEYKTTPVNSYNYDHVSETAVVPSAFLGTEEQIKKQVKSFGADKFVSSYVSDTEYQQFAHKTKIAEISSHNVVSEEAINKIIEFSKTENKKIDLPMNNGNYLSFVPVSSFGVSSPDAKIDVTVSLISFDNPESSDTKSTLLYSTSATEKEHVSIGAVYSSYAEGMGIERLSVSSDSTTTQAVSDERVFYAIGAATIDISNAQKSDSAVNIPASVKYIHPSLVKSLEKDGVTRISINNKPVSLQDYKNAKIDLKNNSFISESAFLGRVNDFKKFTEGTKASESFKINYFEPPIAQNNSHKVKIKTEELRLPPKAPVTELAVRNHLNKKFRVVTTIPSDINPSHPSVSDKKTTVSTLPDNNKTTNKIDVKNNSTDKPPNKIKLPGNVAGVNTLSGKFVVNNKNNSDALVTPVHSKTTIAATGLMNKQANMIAQNSTQKNLLLARKPNITTSNNQSVNKTTASQKQNTNLSVKVNDKPKTVPAKVRKTIRPEVTVPIFRGGMNLSAPQKIAIGSDKKSAVIITGNGYKITTPLAGKKVSMTVFGTQFNVKDYGQVRMSGMEQQARFVNNKMYKGNVYPVYDASGKVHLSVNPLLFNTQAKVKAFIRNNNKSPIVKANIRSATILAARNALATRNFAELLNVTKTFNAKIASQVNNIELPENEPLIKMGMRAAEEKAEKASINAAGTALFRQIFKMSGLTSANNYLFAGAKAIFGYTSPIRIIGDFSKSNNAWYELDKLKSEILYGQLTSDLSSLSPNIYKNHNFLLDTRKGRGEFVKNLKALSQKSFGINITRYSDIKIKKILSSGEFKGAKLTKEQREQLIAALRYKGYIYRDFSAFDIIDNLKRKGIVIKRKYNFTNEKDVASFLREINSIAQREFSTLLNGTPLNELSTEQLKELIAGMNGKVPVKLQELAKTHLEFKELAKNLKKVKISKRGRFNRLALIGRKYMSQTDIGQGINFMLTIGDFAKLAQTVVMMLLPAKKRAAIQDKQQKKLEARLKQKQLRYDKRVNKRSARKEKIKTKKAQRKANFSKKYPNASTKINKTKSKINKVSSRRKSKAISKGSSRLSRVLDKFKRTGAKISNFFGKITKPFNLAKQAINKLLMKILPIIIKVVAITVAILTALVLLMALIFAITGSAQSIIWHFKESGFVNAITNAWEVIAGNDDDGNGIADLDEDNLDLNPSVSLMQDRVEFCIGLDSALKAYTQVMCEKDSYSDEFWGDGTKNTATEEVLECEELEAEKENWFDPVKKDYAQIEDLGCYIDGIQTGIHYSYYDGDGNIVGLKSNAKDIVATANAWMYEDYNAKGLFKSYVEKLWCYSHAVTYMPRKYSSNFIYKCDLSSNTNPCFNNKYDYYCNKKSTSFYIFNGSTYKGMAKMQTDVSPVEYNEKGCKEHKITYCGGKGALFSSKASLIAKGCTNIRSVTAPKAGSATRDERWYCGGENADCTSCRNKKSLLYTHSKKLYHNSPSRYLGDSTYDCCSNYIIAGSAPTYCNDSRVFSRCSNATWDTISEATCSNVYSYSEVNYEFTSDPPYVITWIENYYVCGGHLEDCDNHSEQMFDGSKCYYECNGHGGYEYYCAGHEIILELDECKGYCDGHSLKYCTGHVDLDVSIVTLFLDDENGLTKLGVPTKITWGEKETIDMFGDKSTVKTQTADTSNFVSLYQPVNTFKSIKRNVSGSDKYLLPLPDPEDVKAALKFKLSELDNVQWMSNETVDTLRFLWLYTAGEYPYDDGFSGYTTLDDLVSSYFTKFATHGWQDTNDQGAIDGVIGQTFEAGELDNLAGVYQKFGKESTFEGFYQYDKNGNIETAVVDGKTVYLDYGNVSRAETIYSDDWKDVYDIDFPGTVKPTFAAPPDTDGDGLPNESLTSKLDSNGNVVYEYDSAYEEYYLLRLLATQYHGNGVRKMASSILNSVAVGNTYSNSQGGNLEYIKDVYSLAGKTLPFTMPPASVTDAEAIKYLYNNNKSGGTSLIKPFCDLSSYGDSISNSELQEASDNAKPIVKSLKTGDLIFIGDEVFIVLYNTAPSETTLKADGSVDVDGVDVGEIILATVAGGTTPRLISYRTETFCKPYVGFGYIKT